MEAAANMEKELLDQGFLGGARIQHVLEPNSLSAARHRERESQTARRGIGSHGLSQPG